MAKTNLRDVMRVIVRCRDLENDELSSGARHALLALASFYPNIRPTQPQLAAMTGTSTRTVNRWLRELEDAGLIMRKRGWHQRATVYLLAAGLTATPSNRSPDVDDQADESYF